MTRDKAKQAGYSPALDAEGIDAQDRGRLRIRELAQLRGKTLLQLSQALHMNDTYLQQHCSVNKRQPWVLPEDKLRELAVMLDVQADEIRTPYRQRRRPALELRQQREAAAEDLLPPGLAEHLAAANAPTAPRQCSLELAMAGETVKCMSDLKRGDLVVATTRREGGSLHLEARKVEQSGLADLLAELSGGFVLKVVAQLA